MNVVLVGYRGTGKSVVARLLGNALGLQVVSLDAKLVEEAGKPIPEVVAERGWPGFRDLEEEIVYKILNAMYSDLEQLKKAHDKFKDIEMEKGLIGMGIPLHPGAEKYFKEKGIK